ncbi:dual specificity protein phosphatase family protein [Psychromonas sp. PT13]|uniref:phosphatase PAP2 family protein n=1 Tax=Psychromonas sp. PT13 TaxID=3439547 RepID=UPI003EBDC822
MILSEVKPFYSAMQSPASLKERVVWVLYLGGLFFLLYGAANEFANATAPHLSLFGDWEKHIPFIPAFIVPYMSSDIVFVIAFLLPQSRFALRVLAVRVLFIVLLSVFVFVIFPLQFSFVKPPVESFTFLFTLLEADKPFNQLPSLHVSFSIVFWFSMKSAIKNKALTFFLGIWLILIITSTLFVYQHHFIDLPTGLAVGLFAVVLFGEKRNTYLLNRFMTPRHLKMALYFLLASIILMVLSFKLHFVFIYPFISVLSVSIIYAFGLNDFLLSKSGQVNKLNRVLFAPYFLGCKLSWGMYKRSLPLFAKVDDQLYFGRQPSVEEYSKISELGLKHVINLASELQFNQSAVVQQRVNFLDQTMQDPVALHQVVLQIEANKRDGVYVHCALGLSRSILVIWAWMIFNGKKNDEIINYFTRVRPRFVQSQYMRININLYCDYLANQTH